METRFIETNHIRLHLVESGPKDGPLVILLHGYPEFWYGWNHQIDALASTGCRVLVPDQRGYHLSDKPPGLAAYRLDELAKDILGLISAVGQEKAIVVGHDWGGIVAWWMGICYPEALSRLVILNAPHPGVMRRQLMFNPLQFFHSLYALFFQIPRLPEAMLRANDWERLAKVLIHTSRPGTFSPGDLEQYRQAWRQKDAMTCMLNWYRASFRMPPSIPANSRVHTPTLILWGKRDVALRRTLAEKSIEMCDQGDLIFFEEASHWVQHEEAEKVNRLITRFIG
ncbi:MAG: alpha/beta hydrolase [Chloroflexota bacterium]|nr:MAG: alpha/beta hydrolase [Chloroflexota bacterium]